MSAKLINRESIPALLKEMTTEEKAVLVTCLLYTSFKDMIGMSFQQYVALLRFDRARRLVEHTSMSITTICME